jgi:hypothetical protein
MLLTAQEQERIVESAKLDQLIAGAILALRGGNDAARQAALIALADFRTATLDLELRDRASAARAAAADTMINDALKLRANVAQNLTPLGEVFDAVALIAASGKKHLLFPRLAASASILLETVQQLQATVEKVRHQLAAVEIDDLGDVQDAITADRTALEQLNSKIPRT